MRDTVIVAATRTAVGKAPRGSLATVRPDDMAGAVVAGIMKGTGLEPALVDDLILGCAFPEGEQGLNMARQVVFLGGLNKETTAMTLNRYCSSGLEAVHLAALKVGSGVADCILARCRALAELGFDDQTIIDKEGRVNRGDRIQLFHYLFKKDE